MSSLMERNLPLRREVPMSSAQPAERPARTGGPGFGAGSAWRAIRRFTPSVLLLTLLGVNAAYLYSALSTPTYEASTTFFADSAPDSENSALEKDEFVQRRINSYVGVVTSESVADLVLQDTGVDLTRDDLRERIIASVDPETVLLQVQVRDTSPRRAELVATSIANNLNGVVQDLEGGTDESSILLTAISGPTLAPEPVTPRTELNLAIGLLLGLGVGIAQALLRDQLDRTYRSRDQLAGDTGFPVLAVVPHDRAARKDPILSEQQMHTRRAESFRHLRTSLRFIDAASPARVILVSSSAEEEGKSTTAANLAITLAVAGERVLLVDADLRRPSLERYLGIESGAGLTNALVDRTPLDQLVQSWPRYGLDILATGPLPPNPAELLGSDVMAEVLQSLRARYDVIVLDTPPLLPVTDAAVLSALADGVMLVVRYGSTRQDQVHQSLEGLGTIKSRVLGTVLTMSREKADQGSSSYYQSSADRA